ncbi:hypothetical protein HQ520_11645, partial [bacterium]|nr:hypothetical protein [bacterium]
MRSTVLLDRSRGDTRLLLPAFFAGVFLLVSSLAQAVTIGIEAEDFQCYGDWIRYGDSSAPVASDEKFLFATNTGAPTDAATGIQIPSAGRYYLWVRATDFPDYQPATRLFNVSVDGQMSASDFGDSGLPDWAWEPGGFFDLQAEVVLIGIHDKTHFYGRCDAVLLTTDSGFTPSGNLGGSSQP